MMNDPPTPKKNDEICLMCKRPKKDHTHEELLACMKKKSEFREERQGGAGIE